MPSHVITLIKPRLLFLLFLTFYLGWVFYTYQDYGVAIDEPMEYRFGEMLYNRNFGHDPQLIHDFAYEGKDSREIWSHNHFQVMLMYILNDTGSVVGYHVLNLIFATISFWVVYEIVLHVAHQPLLALVGSLSLFFTPRFLGDIPSNVKDPVFATYYLLALLAMIKTKSLKWWWRIPVLGLFFGLAAAYRTVGYSLLGVYGLYSGLNLIRGHQLTLKSFTQLSLVLFGLLIPMVAIHALEMPFVASDPFHHLWRLMQVAQAFPWQGTILFNGNLVTAGQLPWSYVPLWMLVTTPIFNLIFFSLSVKYWWRDRTIMILTIAFWFNLALYFILNPVIYDGIRHLLYLQVIAAVLAVTTFAKIWSQAHRRLKIILSSFLVLSLLLVGKQYRSLHPYEYTYFNELVGYLPGASGKFETDYWGVGYKEGSKWLIAKLGSTPATIGLCGNEEARMYFTGTPHKIVWIPYCDHSAKSGAQYVLAYGRNNEWDKVPGKVIYSVSREGVPLMKVYKL
jgi:hypothetical protein